MRNLLFDGTSKTADSTYPVLKGRLSAALPSTETEPAL